jgi:peptidoglycan/LPS O-acetylase OafA/YrhL
VTRRSSPAPVATGMLGVAAVLYCLSQLATLVPPDDLDRIQPLDGLFRSANLAVSMLLAGIGFAVTTSLRKARETSVPDTLRAAASALVPVVVVVALVCLAALGFGRYDSTDQVPSSVTHDSVVHVLSFQWNDWVRDHPLGVRPDLASLWIFSVVVQLVLVALLAVLLLGRIPTVLAVLTGGLAIASCAWRLQVLDASGWFAASLDTTARADAFLVGMTAALLAPRLRISAATAGALCGAMVLVLVGLVLASSFVTVEGSLAVIGPIGGLAAAAVSYAAQQRPAEGSLAVGLLSGEEVVQAGAMWTCLVGWSPFVVVTVARHATQQGEALAVVVALFATVLASLATRQAMVVAADWIHKWWAGRHPSPQADAPCEESVGAEDTAEDGRPRGEPAADR